MLKEFIEHIQTTTAPTVMPIGEHHFRLTHDGDMEEILPKIQHPDTLPLNSLDGLVKLVKTEAMKMASPLYITIPTHTKVVCFAQPQEKDRWYRQYYYEAVATDVPGWEEETSMDFERAQVAMRTRFQETSDIPYLQKLLSEITLGAKVTRNDNGVATSIVTQKGVSLQENATIRPIVNLRPYRTFQEVEQPESAFLIRVDERSIRFIGADGGMWKLKARQTIKEFLENHFTDEIESGTVVVAL